jgi:tetratricopeptide (TPR) repeat protein
MRPLAARRLTACIAGLAASLLLVAAGADYQGIEGPRLLLNQGLYKQAEAEARELLTGARTTHGEDSVEAARVIDCLVEALWRGGKGKDPETEALARRALETKQRILGLESTEVAATLGQLGHVLRFKGQYDAARPLLERALEIRLRAFGPDHLDVAASLSDLAVLLRETESTKEAREYFERALAIQRKALGPNHPDLARNLKDLAAILRDSGQYEDSRRMFETAIELTRKAYGPDHPDIASSLNGLAITLEELGDYDAAKPLLERALAIQRQILGPDHFRLAATLNNLAFLNRSLANYEAARPLYEKAIAIWRNAAGPDSTWVARSMANLAEILQLLGDFQEARSLYERALAIQVKALGPDDPTVAWTVVQLARLHETTGNRREARPLYERALSVFRKRYGPDHPDVALILTDLAQLASADGQTREARSLLEEALSILSSARGAEHPDVARTLIQLAVLLRDTGDARNALAHAERALAIREKTLGPEHPLVAEAFNTLAGILADLGRRREAFDAALRAEEIGRNHLRLTARTLPERQALQYASIRAAGLDLALSMAVETEGEIPGAASRAWDALIRSRALVLDEMASRHRALEGSADPDVRRLEEEHVAASTRLAHLVVRGPDPDHPERYRDLLAAARQSKEAAERALAEKSSRHRAETESPHASLADVLRRLPAETALVSFCLYNREPRAALRRGGVAPRRISSYLAFIARPGCTDPALVPLGAADEVDPLIARWRDEVSGGQIAAGRSPAQAVAAYRLAGEPVRRAAWDPVAARTGGAARVLLVPDGALDLLSFPSLPSTGDSYLIETGPLIHHLSAEKDLLHLDGGGPAGRGLLALGGPAFDEADPTPSHAGEVFRGQRSGCGDFQSIQFAPLPAAGLEVQEIASLWQEGRAPAPPERDPRTNEDPPKEPAPLLLVGPEATEGRLKEAAPGRRIIHLATHGFFLGGRCASLPESSRGIGGIVPTASGGPPGPATQSPLLASGLALAGANRRALAGPDQEDGILTAEEIAALDLSGVRWVVLSGCDTAAGDIRAGEGVLGLRRAFRVAGAATLIMSLWSVEDEAARRWMRGLYEALGRRRLGTAESVRRASLDLLEEQRKGGRSTHPFYWAAFVAEGDWR